MALRETWNQRLWFVNATPDRSAPPSTKALAQLPAVERDVLVLRLVTRLSVEQVASLLDRPASDIRTIQYRGLQRLRTEERGFAAPDESGVDIAARGTRQDGSSTNGGPALPTRAAGAWRRK